MSTDYPPLPRPGDTKAPVVEEMLSTEGSSANTASSNKVSKSDPDVPTVICHRGDVIIEYTEQSSAISRRWQVSSKSLMRNSPYFQAMLDPDKFAEGRLLAHQKENQAQHSKLALSSDTKVDSDAAEHSVLHDLPTVKLSESPLTRMCGADAIGVFLKILCVGAQDLKGRYAFENELRAMPPSIVERTIEISEAFSSSGVVIETLKRAMYMFGRTKMVMKKFNEIFLKWSEDRVRQNIIIAISLQETQIAQVMMHTLIVMGSKYWVNGPEVPTSLYPRWRYLAHGIEGTQLPLTWKLESLPTLIYL